MGSVGVSSGPGQQGPGVNSINQGLNWRELVELVSVYVPVWSIHYHYWYNSVH